MPEISRFYGIVVKMFYDDHYPPHFHVEYGSYNATIDIETIEIISGRLPSKCYELIKEWTRSHQEEIKSLWIKAKNFQLLNRIEPLE